MQKIHDMGDRALEKASNFLAGPYEEFAFKDFRPKLFTRLREIFEIQIEEYAVAFEKTCNEKFSEGEETNICMYMYVEYVWAYKEVH
jgi:hypothetical protein